MYEKAIDSFEYVMAIDDKYQQALISSGQSYEALEQFDKAIESYHEALEISPKDAQTYYRLGECYEKHNDFDEALKHYRQATELDEYMAEPWAGIAVIFLMKKTKRKLL